MCAYPNRLPGSQMGPGYCGLQPRVHLRTKELYVMEVALFILWFGIMCLLGIRVYLAHQSLKKPKDAKEG